MYYIETGDCRELMRACEPESADVIITDPPYELNFMGAAWDRSGITFDPDVWKEALRVLKPGGHMAVFGSPRLFHRVTAAIEDAGFEIRDVLSWLYSSGFPKSHNVANSIDKLKGEQYQARTLEGADWTGYGTALKPAWEPIIIARKPFKGTVAANVLKHGTGALNIDASRIGTGGTHGGGRKASSGFVSGYEHDGFVASDTGRWPANVLLDEDAAEVLDEQSGVSKGRASGYNWDESKNDNPSRIATNIKSGIHFGDSGGVSRFFFVSKASRSERDRGTKDGNRHPTVKPVSLMRYLVRLLTPPDGVVFDPFTGSGSTGIGAVLEGFRFVGYDLDPDNVDLATDRIQHAIDDPEAWKATKTK